MGCESWTYLLSSLPTQFCVCLSCNLRCTRVFLPVSKLFSVRSGPHVDMFLMCFWEEVQSASSSSTIVSVYSLYIISLKHLETFSLVKQMLLVFFFKGNILNYGFNLFDTQCVHFLSSLASSIICVFKICLFHLSCPFTRFAQKELNRYFTNG